MTQDNIVKIYISAMEQFTPDSIEWEGVYEFADKMISEIQQLLDAYQTPKND